MTTFTNIAQLFPAWTVDGWHDLKNLYSDVIKQEIAWEEFVADFDKPQKKSKENPEGQTHSWRVEAATGYMKGAEGGVISGIKQAKEVIGKRDERGKGTNYLLQITSWQAFGLLTGFSMEGIYPSIVPDAKKPGILKRLFNSAEAKLDATKFQQLEGTNFLTNVAGAAEPGLPGGARNTEAGFLKTKIIEGVLRPEDPMRRIQQRQNNLLEGRWGVSKEVLKKYGGGGSAGGGIYPYFLDTSITLRPFLKTTIREGTDEDKYGHFSSPEYIMYMRALRDPAFPGLADKLLSWRSATKNAAEKWLEAAPEHDEFPKNAKVNEKSWEAVGVSGIFVSYSPRAAGQRSKQEAQPDVWSPHAVPGITRTLDRGGKKIYVPDYVSVWPTMPAAPTNSPAMHPTYADTEWAAMINEFWIAAYEEFVDGKGPLADAHEIIKKSLVAGIRGRPLFGSTDRESSEYKKQILPYINRIFRFYGEDIAPDEVTKRNKAVGTGGAAAATLRNSTEANRKQLLNVRNLKPFDFQCFLMENIDIISAYQETKSSYDNVVRITGDPATTISRINMGGKFGEIHELLNLTPAVYGMLVPYIKIYRVDYDKENPAIAIAQKEMPIPNFIDPADIDQLTGKGSGRYGGWGLKSLSWTLQGIQPEDVDNNITATLEFYFQSVNDLFQGSSAAGRPTPNPLDLLISAQTLKTIRGKAGEGGYGLSGNKRKPRCGDVLKNNINQQYDGAQFRIKVIAGWATPPNLQELMPESTPSQLLLLERAISSTRISLFLQQVRHDLDFKQDGSIGLSIEYQAALSGMLTSNRVDILGTNDKEAAAEIKAMKAKAKGKKEELEELEEEVSSGADKGTREAELSNKRKAYKALLEQESKILNKNKLKKYKRFLSRLYGRTSGGYPMEERSKIYSLEVNPRELYLPPLAQETDPIRRAERALNRMGANAQSRGFFMRSTDQMSTSGTPPKWNTDLLAVISKEKTTPDAGEGAAALAKQWEGSFGSSDNIFIPYFYLGDLIDTIVENNEDIGSHLYREQKKKAPYLTFLSDIDITNPLLYYQLENQQAVQCADSVNATAVLRQLQRKGYVFEWDPAKNLGVKKRINIGSIPISLDLFNVWFKNNVIAPGKPSYYLLHFIKDICSDLISDALRSSCMGDNIIDDIRFDTSIVQFSNIHQREPKWRRLYPKDGNKKSNPQKVFSVDRLAAAVGALNPHNDVPSMDTPAEERKNFNVTAGLVVYGTDSRLNNRFGDYIDDMFSGIYHNYIGSAAGLVKDISFAREDQPYLRESKIQKYGNLGAQQLRELYSVNIEMIGNTLYKNGQHTFIWPTMVASDDYFAQLLGLGGYFMITGVTHVISPSGYNVTLRALQQGLAFRSEPVRIEARRLQGVRAGVIHASPDWTRIDPNAEQPGEYLNTTQYGVVSAIPMAEAAAGGYVRGEHTEYEVEGFGRKEDLTQADVERFDATVRANHINVSRANMVGVTAGGEKPYVIKSHGIVYR